MGPAISASLWRVGLPYILLVCICTSVVEGQQVTEELKQLLAPGYAVNFDGVDDFFAFGPTHGAHFPNETFYDGSYTCWIKHASKGLKREAVMGFPEEEGPSFRMISSPSQPEFIDLTAVTSWSYSERSNCTTHTSTFPDDQEWHFLGLSYNLTSMVLMVDGVIQVECYAQIPIENAWADHDYGAIPKQIVFGRYQQPLFGPVQPPESDNRQAFYGALDDVRVYTGALTLSELSDVHHSRPQQRLDNLLARFTFDNGGPLIEAVGEGKDNFIVYTGDGYQVFYPMFDVSSAPLFTIPTDPSTENSVATVDMHSQLTAVERTQMGANQSTVMSLSVVDRSRGDPALSGTESPFQFLLLSNETEGSSSVNGAIISGVIRLTDGSSVSLSDLPVIVNSTTIVLECPVGLVGTMRMRAQLLTRYTLTPTTDETTHDIHVQMTVVNSRQPLAGSAGHAIMCDGKNDYLYAPYFRWPSKNYLGNDGTVRTGGGPITVEGWVFLIKDFSADSALWSIGLGEQTKDWVDNWNPYRKTGRFYMSIPGPSRQQEFRFDVGSLSRASGSTTAMGGQWLHFAAVHTQVSGNFSRVYINGELITDAYHDHLGVGIPTAGETSYHDSTRRVEGFSVCSWMFWSGVFHTGAVDEIRIWNYTRTQEEIRADMHTSLLNVTAGDDKLKDGVENLAGYWTFDEPDGAMAYDYSGHHNHLRAAGCAPCDNGLDENGENNTYYQAFNAKTRMQVCDPIAQGEGQEWYTDAPIAGGSYCYYGIDDYSAAEIKAAYTRDMLKSDTDTLRADEALWAKLGEDENKAAVPERIISTAPMGEFIFAQTIRQNQATIQLNGTNQDSIFIQFVITKLLPIGNMSYIDLVGDTQAVVENELLPVGVDHVTVVLNETEAIGEFPFSFMYASYDGMLYSEPTLVKVHVSCGGGMYADGQMCRECPAGFYSDTDSVDQPCMPCGINNMQEKTGQTECVPCGWGKYTEEIGSTSCLPCSQDSSLTHILSAEDFESPLTIEVDGVCEAVLSLPDTQPGFVLKVSPSNEQLHRFDRAGTLMNDTYDRSDWTLSLSSYPRVGEVYQVIEQEDGTLQRATESLQSQLSLSVVVFSQYASSVLDPQNYYEDGPWQNVLGLPDAQYFKPYRYTEGNVEIDVQFAEALYPVKLEVTVGPASAHLREVRVPIPVESSRRRQPENITSTDGRQWKTVWRGTSSTTEMNEAMDVELCPLAISTDTVRLVFDSTDADTSHGVELDSVRYFGNKELGQQVAATVTDPDWRVYYQPGQPPNSTKDILLNFMLRPCGSGENSAVTVSLQSVVRPERGQVGTGQWVILGLLCGVFELLLIASLVAIIYLRKHPRIRRASSMFLNFMLVGCILAVPSPLIGAIETESAWPCVVSSFMWAIGFVLTFGSLFVKTYRISMIFNSSLNALNQGLKCSNRELLISLSVMMGVTVVFLAIYYPLTDNSKEIVLVGDKLWLTCPMSVDQYVILASQAAMMSVGAVLAFQVRRVPSDFKESSLIGMAIYNWIFLTVGAIPILLLTPSDNNTTLIIRSVYIMLNFMVTATLLVFYKLFLIHHDRNKEMRTSLMSETGNHPPYNRIKASPRLRDTPGDGPHASCQPLSKNSSAETRRSVPMRSSMFTSSGGTLLDVPSHGSSIPRKKPTLSSQSEILSPNPDSSIEGTEGTELRRDHSLPIGRNGTPATAVAGQISSDCVESVLGEAPIEGGKGKKKMEVARDYATKGTISVSEVNSSADLGQSSTETSDKL